MKRKVRAITVKGQKFAWWCSISQHETTVKLSPFEDKTSVLSIFFSDDGCADNVEKICATSLGVTTVNGSWFPL